MALDNSCPNLRGRNFKGQDLAGVNFSYADIRGANFTNANLTGANFSHAKAGLQRRWEITYLALISLLFLVLSGFFSYLTYYFLPLTFQAFSLEKQITAFTTLILLIAFFLKTIVQGVEAGLQAFPFAFTLTVAVAAFAKGGIIAVFTGAAVGGLTIAVVVIVAVAFAVTVAAFTKTVAVTGAIVVIVALTSAVAVSFARPTSGKILVVIAIISGALALTFAVALFSIYIGWRAMKGDGKYALIRNIAVTFAAIEGTSFCGANLTNANFTAAMLKSTDFRNTILANTCWHQAKMLDRVCPGLTYLQNSEVRQLLVTGQGQDKNFDGQSLRGINLKEANLADASFIGADLSEANLQDADLSRAKLKQTQLDGTDLTGATLTGAYIEDWGITNTTKLHGARCEYVFMRLPTKEDPDPLRKPDNKQEVFEDGDFADFIKPIFDTLDLYHNQGVDPRAVAIAFKNLAQNHPEAELEIVAMEKRGDDKILLRAKTAEGSDESQLRAEYFDDYNQLKALSQSQQLLLVEKDSYISDLKNMITTALGQPKSYTQGNTIMSDISGINIQGSSNVSGIAGNNSIANLGTISGNVSIALNQLPDATDAEKPGIKELLSQLQDAIVQSTYLSEEDKTEALEQVKTLAEAGKNPQESTKQKTAKTAITMLKGIFTGLPAVASLVEAGNKLLPAISKLFGLG
ncbi:MAG: pentapeptide repeat-containing protein [Nostoc sp. DedQUE08]|uniref:pentapeptide repeat-containing protein n=1 Tax=unclassified Nostoc TaxID=2593658 RepID=UPI002AD58DE5|nr:MULTISPECIES: pentapeptide repeat-containing protein [unclassified Nostoc]MDZ8070842.1 pentapeptide repeat-containing protein [Nostoc sp. DedQUE08]MDZ8095753.1 pentapeptide repeat-containing protein [Nostoc sp. DedQUE05]